MDPSQLAAYGVHFHPPPPLPPSFSPPPLPPPPQPLPPSSADFVHPSNPVPSHPSYTENSYQLSSLSALQSSPIPVIPPSPQQQQSQQQLPQQQQQFIPVLSTPLSEQPSSSAKRKPGRPPKVKQPAFGPEMVAETVPKGKIESEVMGSDQLVGKKRRGRPAKVVVGLEQVILSGSGGVSNGQIEKGSLVKRRGRPRKKQKEREVEGVDEEVVVEPQELFQVEVEEGPVQPVNEVDVVKRGSGRLKKVVNYNDDDYDYYNANANANDNANADANANANATGLVSDNVEKRKKRGWPAGRPRGKRVVAMAVSGVRRRGRKPKGGLGMVEKKLYSGKARGRPKKNSHGQEVANEELLRKLEEMQSKLRDAVGVLRPHVATLSAPDALIALQQLEGLSTMNVTSSPALTAVQVIDIPIDVTAEVPPPSTSAP
ncbi:hypothetical protein KSS87_014103 [Heliosperma pusillum]|nr:hypothetical protein KSS87_014103 [Heliosperma pusillum]